jgi:hypothetical protein
MQVDGQLSLSLRYRYEAPVVLRVEGATVSSLDTRGGEEVRLVGENLGTQAFLGNVTYGPTARPYVARNCRVSVPHTEVLCETVPGAGARLPWRATVGGQTSVDSDVSGGGEAVSSYEAPQIISLSPLYLSVEEEAAGGHVTSGGVRMVVRGSGFGPPGGIVAVLLTAGGSAGAADPESCVLAQVAAQSGSQSSGGVPAYARLPTGCALVVSQTHDEVRFDTPPGEGAGLSLRVYVNGALSNAVPYSYSPPVVKRLTALEPAEEAGHGGWNSRGATLACTETSWCAPYWAARHSFMWRTPMPSCRTQRGWWQ